MELSKCKRDDQDIKFPYIPFETKHKFISQISDKALYMDCIENLLRQESVNNLGNQRFLIKPVTDNDVLFQQGYVILQCEGSGKVLTVEHQSLDRGVRITQAEYDGGNESQLFLLMQQQEKRAFCIKNKRSGMFLDVQGGSKDDGAYIVQWEYSGAENQVFYINEVEQK